MSAGRFLLDPLPAAEVVVLDGAEGRHAATVRRIGVGEHIVVGDGRGRLRQAEVTATGRDQLVLRCGPTEFEPAPDPRLIVVQALPKGDRAELAVELLTELGVDAIVPWAARRSVVQWRGERADRSRLRWQHTAREAGKQSRRAWLPEVAELHDTAAVARLVAAAAAKFVLHEDATTPLAMADLPAHGDVLVVVGPEGGIAPEEIEVFRSAGGRPVRLGTPVLRTSTAGAAALAVLSARLGRWA